MVINLKRFHDGCDPAKALDISEPVDRARYIDFASVRGGVIEEIERSITKLANNSVCHLFTGNVGCGKSTELYKLKFRLEKEGYYVVFVKAEDYMELGDVEIADIFLSIAHQILKNLEKDGILIQSPVFQNLLQKIFKFLTTDIEGAKIKVPGLGDLGYQINDRNRTLSFILGEITKKSKDSVQFRERLREETIPETTEIIKIINNEIIGLAKEKLRSESLKNKGLVVIVDGLDRVELDKIKSNNHTLPVYLFVDSENKLKQLNCHVIYIIPFVLVVGPDLATLQNNFGEIPKLLPLVRVCSRDGRSDDEGMELMRQMVLARAVPDVQPGNSLNLIPSIFDSIDTLNRLCRISGGHVRNLLTYIRGCLGRGDLPISRKYLEEVIQSSKDTKSTGITSDDWKLLAEISKSKKIGGEEKYRQFIKNLWVFKYQDSRGAWFDIDPILAETEEFMIAYKKLDQDKEENQNGSTELDLINNQKPD